MTELVSSTLVAGRDNTGDNINRDLEQVISNIDRQDTPMYSSVGSRKVSHTHHEWMVDSYQDAEFQAYNENYQYAAGDVSQQVRTVLSNYTQIFNEPYGVSETAVAVDTAGVANEFKYQEVKKAVRMRRNLERQILANPGSGSVQFATKNGTEGSNTKTGGRRFGSIFSYAGTHALAGTPASGTNLRALTELADDDNNGTDNTVTAATALDSAAEIAAFSPRANGTSIVRASYGGTGADASLTRRTFADLLATMYGKGARPTMAMMSPTMKVEVSDVLFADGSLTGIIQRMDALQKKLNMAITGLETDFGFTIGLIPNWLYNNAAGTGNSDPNTILAYDPAMMKIGTLREMKPKSDLRQAGDGMSGLLTCEKTFIVQNPDAIGVLHGVSTS